MVFQLKGQTKRDILNERTDLWKTLFFEAESPPELRMARFILEREFGEFFDEPSITIEERHECDAAKMRKAGIKILK